MRILITNDDGIRAEGLQVLRRLAADIAGPDNVWTVAPANEVSGVAHCISFSHPMRIEQISKRDFAVSGSPADCILATLFDVMPHAWPDLVLSGVNRGNNSAENTLYSGTVGAVMEAALHGVKGIALSQFYGPENRGLANPFEAAEIHGAAVIRRLLDAAPWHDGLYEVFYNVNFPPVPAAEVAGIRAVRQGFRPRGGFSASAQQRGMRRFLWVEGSPQDVPSAPGSDAYANLQGFVSITPMCADLTADDTLDKLGEIFN
ncbi:MAG: 5'/3'-nucleotidase SurE [Rhodobacteraceae bacterium]|nr:5'/3'-nucleotidase SurE [Paracoccaceae bacterium]